MSKIVRLLHPEDEAKMLRAMARAHWRFAVERRIAGDEERYLELMQEVRGLDDEAHDAEIRAAHLEIQERRLSKERREAIAAIDDMLGRFHRQRADERKRNV